MTHKSFLAPFTLGVVSLSLAVGAAPAASVVTSSVCPPNSTERVDYFSPAVGENWDREELTEHWEWFGDQLLPSLAAEGLTGTSMIHPAPTQLTEFFTTGALDAFEEYRQTIESLADRVEESGGETANDVRDSNAARYEYILAITNGFVDAYNADHLYDHFGQPGWGNANEYFFYVIGRMLYGFEGDVSARFDQLGSWYPVSAEEIQSAFAVIKNEWTQSGLSETEAEARTRSTMTEAIEEWVERQALSSLTSFQVGAKNNLEMAANLGYVVETEDPHYPSLATGSNQGSTRAMKLSDLAHSVPGWLRVDEYILEANLDPTGEEFLAPEIAAESPYVRGVVEDYLEPLTSLTVATPEEFAEATQKVVMNQLSEAHWLADDFDQTPLEFAYLFDEYSGDYLYYFEDLENKQLQRATDWRTLDGSLEYDAIRASQFDDTPFTAILEHESKTVKRIVRYSSVDSAQLVGADSVQQQAEFCSTRNLLTGTTDWNTETIMLPEVVTPPASHPAQNATLGTPTEVVDAVIVTPNSEETTIVDVVFPVDFTVTIHHVDETGAALPAKITKGHQRVTGPWNETATVAPITHDDWELAPGSKPVNVQFTEDQPEVTFTYKSAPNPGSPDGKEEPDESTSDPVAQTGATDPLLMTILGASLLLAGGLFAIWRVRRAGS